MWKKWISRSGSVRPIRLEVSWAPEGGTAWLLDACRREWAPDSTLGEWLGREKRILLHAGGQSRRLPGYAPSGKVLTPVSCIPLGEGAAPVTESLVLAASVV